MSALIRRITEHKKFLAWAQIVLIYVLPIVLFYYRILPQDLRMIVLGVMCLLIYGIMQKEHLDLSHIGLTVPIKKYFKPYFLWTFLAALFIVGYSVVFDFSPQASWWINPHFWFIFALVSFFQEFAYRGFLPILLKRITKSPLIEIFLNALLFTLLHVLFPHLFIALPLAFLGGLFFSMLYHFYPDLILVSISHAVLNFLAVMFGFFVLAL
jgi:membrane protease YdiL (CAAX protease family)